MLLIAGLRVPDIPLLETAGNVKVPPTHILETCVNVGVNSGLTTTVIEVGAAHCPGAGVKSYRILPAVDVDSPAGLQVPVIPLLDVVGSIGWVMSAF